MTDWKKMMIGRIGLLSPAVCVWGWVKWKRLWCSGNKRQAGEDFDVWKSLDGWRGGIDVQG
ncbi:hypothetical protein CGZ60_07200 [Neisseria animalis]|nr:hypothetical protein CGZ60_07200 [Neisseria animalis]